MAGPTKAELEAYVAELEEDLDEKQGEIEALEREMQELQDRLGPDDNYALPATRSRLSRLAREVTSMPAYLRKEFEAHLAEETGDAWTRLPKVTS